KRQATSAECCHAPIQLDLEPVQLIPPRRPRACGVRPPNAKAHGTTSLPSPTTTTSNTPSMPESTRCSCPLHQVPTRPNCSPNFLNTESSATQVHCQRLRVAALLLAA